MAKSRKLEVWLDRLTQLRQDCRAIDGQARSPEVKAELEEILACPQAVAVAQAAKLISDVGLDDLTPALTAAFERLRTHSAQADPNCLAKTAIAEALYRLEAPADEVFLQGIRHVQLEPVWGGTVDTAAKLRGSCALGLVRMRYPSVLVELGDLLADREMPARIAAARAIAYCGDVQGVPLLRLRVLVGDEPTVVAECVAALLQLAPKSIEFVATCLEKASVPTQELVALALGESRLPEALPILQDWGLRQAAKELRQAAFLSVAMLRLDPALNWLIETIATGPVEDAKLAIAALRLYRQDPNLWDRVRSAAEGRKLSLEE